MKKVHYFIIIAVSLFITTSLVTIMVIITRSGMSQAKEGVEILHGLETAKSDAELRIHDGQIIAGSMVKQLIDFYENSYPFQIATGECPGGFYDTFNIHSKRSSYFINDTKEFRCTIVYAASSDDIHYVQFIDQDLLNESYQPPVFDEAQAAASLEISKLNHEIADYQYQLYERGN